MSWTTITNDPATWPPGDEEIIIKRSRYDAESLLGRCRTIRPNVYWEYKEKYWSSVRPNLVFITPDGNEQTIDAIAWHTIPPLE